MKIIICLNHFFPQQVAGTEVYCLSLVKELKKQGMDVAVLIPNYGQAVNEYYSFENVPVIKYAEPSKVDRELIMGRRKPDGLIAFKAILEEQRPAIIHFHGLGGSNGITVHHVLLAKSLGIKTIFTFHIAGLTCFTGTLIYKEQEPCNGYASPMKCTACVYQSKKIGPLKNRLLTAVAKTTYALGYNTSAWGNSIGTAIGFPFVIAQRKNSVAELANNCDHMVVLTEWYKKVLLLNGISENNLSYFPQALPPQQSVTPRQRAAPNNLLRLVFVGRIVQSKGLHLLLEAMLKFHSAKLSLDVYGQMQEEAYSETCKKIIHTNDNMEWKGVLSPDAIVSTLKNYDVLCIPSVICEMSPLVIQEAFAAGIPVIASDVYGNAEQITHNKNGWLFRFNSVQGLSDVIASLIATPEKIISAANKVPPVVPFAALAADHVALYRNLFN